MIPVLPPPFVPLVHKNKIVGNIDMSGYRFETNDSNRILKIELKIEGLVPHAGTYALSVFRSQSTRSKRYMNMLVLVHEDQDCRKLAPVLDSVREALDVMHAVQADLDAEKAANAPVPANETTH